MWFWVVRIENAPLAGCTFREYCSKGPCKYICNGGGGDDDDHHHHRHHHHQDCRKGGASTLAVERRGLHNFTPVRCIFHNLKISNILPYMQIEKTSHQISSFPWKMNLEKVSSKMFLPLPSVPFDLNPDKESLAKPSNFCQKPRGFKQTAETARRLLCKLKLPINFQPTHSLTCRENCQRGSRYDDWCLKSLSCHWVSWLFHIRCILVSVPFTTRGQDYPFWQDAEGQLQPGHWVDQ